MFLMECKADNSLTIVENENVIYEKNTEVEEDELLTFFVGGKSFLGYVKARGDDEDALKAKQKQWLKDHKKKPGKSNKTSEKVIVSPIKARRILKKESPLKVNSKKEEAKKSKKKNEEKESLKKRHVDTQKEVAQIINQSKSQVLSSSESSDAENSPSKDELKTELKRLRAANGISNRSTSTDNAQLH
ncbi:protein FAM133-like [Neodiprion pinetum]|uniref:protein FAM133-like n=1 Tax=Neodiprion pinetum TaxID=441929 RepID=UPI001EE11501|nr:uncharacterized protein LOC124223044 [Neodiprion pinetum]XP_046490616.1 uncharacterized protein LOC124223044 [Neodiprion pinetum]